MISPPSWSAKEARAGRTYPGTRARFEESTDEREGKPERMAHPEDWSAWLGQQGGLGSGPRHDTAFSSQTKISLLVSLLDVRYAMRTLTAGVNAAPWRHPAHTARWRGRRESMPGAATITLLRHRDDGGHPDPDRTIIAPAYDARARNRRYRRGMPAVGKCTLYISALPYWCVPYPYLRWIFCPF